MRKPDFLVLTDHSGHSDQNSLYALTRKLASDSRTGSVFVVSRADPRNGSFFKGDLSVPVYGMRADAKFRFDATGQQFLSASEQMLYAKADVVWLRLPPPADRTFFAGLTSLNTGSQPVVINNPLGILETGSKAFLCRFPEQTASVRMVNSAAEVTDFATRFPIVLKPVMEYGGRGLVRIMGDEVEVNGTLQPLEEWLAGAKQDLEAGTYLAMKYLKNVSEGDKRILVVNGKVLGASLRIPAAGHWLCNVAQGGTSVPATVSPEEEAIIAAVAPVLLEKGVVIFGADTLVNDDGKRVLSELNTNSIGGFPQAEAQTGLPILQQTIDGIYDYLDARF